MVWYAIAATVAFCSAEALMRGNYWLAAGLFIGALVPFYMGLFAACACRRLRGEFKGGFAEFVSQKHSLWYV